jgi:DNA-binding response OmpR family regulator
MPKRQLVWLVATEGPAREEAARLLADAGFEVWAGEVGRTPQFSLVRSCKDDEREALEAIRTLRRGSPRMPILCITAERLASRLAAFEAGSDDVLSPTVDPEELRARLHVWTRRGYTTGLTWVIEDLVIDEDSRTAHRAGHHLELTSTGFALLALLARRQGENVTRTDLRREVWGESAAEDNVLDVHISRLRKALHAAGPPLLHTVYGVGYRLGPERTQQVPRPFDGRLEDGRDARPGSV